MTTSVLTRKQVKTFTKLNHTDQYGDKVDVIANVRYDDQCSNGHNSFAITGTIYKAGRRSDAATLSCGCIHEEIASAFPALAPLIKWHMMDSGQPMHYVANSLYHVSDTDCNGLKAGEYGSYIRKVMGDIKKDGQLVALYTSGTIYTNKQNNSNLTASNEKELCKVVDFAAGIKPSVSYFIEDENCEYSKSEGKTPNLEHGRSCAIWPDAELSDFTKEKLEARLPALVEDFRKAVESLGFVY